MKSKIIIFLMLLSFVAFGQNTDCGSFCIGDGVQTFTTGFSTNIGGLTYTSTGGGTLVGSDVEVNMATIGTGDITVCVVATCDGGAGCNITECFDFTVEEEIPADCNCYERISGVWTLSDCSAVVCADDQGGTQSVFFGVGETAFGTWSTTPSSITWSTGTSSAFSGAITDDGSGTPITVTVDIEWAPEDCLAPETKTFTVDVKTITSNPECPPDGN